MRGNGTKTSQTPRGTSKKTPAERAAATRKDMFALQHTSKLPLSSRSDRPIPSMDTFLAEAQMRGVSITGTPRSRQAGRVPPPPANRLRVPERAAGDSPPVHHRGSSAYQPLGHHSSMQNKWDKSDRRQSTAPSIITDQSRGSDASLSAPIPPAMPSTRAHLNI